MSYTLARFYDPAQGERAEPAAYLRGLLERHHPAARTVLELACGTGSILKQLQPHYEVEGVDLSEDMLDVARAKLPGVPLHHGDMTEVALGRRFDAVVCVFDSINHLPTFDRWEALFDRALEHLADGGIFVFDMNTERRLADLATQPPAAHWFGDGNLIVFDIHDEGGVYVWHLDVFERVGDVGYARHGETIEEVAFPAERVRSALLERFAPVRAYDARRARPTVRSERLHFVCHSSVPGGPGARPGPPE